MSKQLDAFFGTCFSLFTEFIMRCAIGLTFGQLGLEKLIKELLQSGFRQTQQ